jgi:hypothetical protein
VSVKDGETEYRFHERLIQTVPAERHRIDTHGWRDGDDEPTGSLSGVPPVDVGVVDRFSATGGAAAIGVTDSGP